MSTTLMSLGMAIFSIPTIAYNELQRRRSWRYARNSRVGAPDALQFLGEDLSTVSLSGSAHIELSDPRTALDQLGEMARDGEAYPLVDGAGNVLGTYVIVGLDERQGYFLPDGTARKIDFAIDMLEAPDQSTTSDTAGAAG